MFLREDQTKEVFCIHDTGAFDARRRGECRPIRELACDFDVPGYTSEYLSRRDSLLHVDNAVILDYHLHCVISAMGRDLDAIRARSFRVAMDCCGGAGIPMNYVLLDYLYAKVKCIGDTPGVFPREIEPAPANLESLCAKLAGESPPYDAVFVTDCDNDRCVLVAHDQDTGQYAPLEEDYTLAVTVDRVLADLPHGQTVVTNWSTSQMVKDIYSMHHANLRRVPTGEVYTASDAMHFRAALAGEGSCAGVIDPRVGMGRDLLAAIWHTLAALANSGQDLMSIVGAYPRYEKCSRDHTMDDATGDLQFMIEALQVFYARKSDLAFMSLEDGLIVAFRDNSRVQIRASNTEPILRIRSWSRDGTKAARLAGEAMEAIRSSSCVLC